MNIMNCAIYDEETVKGLADDPEEDDDDPVDERISVTRRLKR